MLLPSPQTRHPGLRVLLSVGGGADTAGEKDKYLTLLETPEKRAEFVNSAKQLLKHHNFDGLDLAWQFPVIKEKKDRGTFGKRNVIEPIGQGCHQQEHFSRRHRPATRPAGGLAGRYWLVGSRSST